MGRCRRLIRRRRRARRRSVLTRAEWKCRRVRGVSRYAGSLGRGAAGPAQGWLWICAADGSSDRSDDLFIPPNELNGAMQGDEVLVDEAPPGRDGRRSGRVARILTRRNPTVVGIFHYARHQRRGAWDEPVWCVGIM